MFLKADGFLAIVIPDGVLTNSTLQYARDWIAQHFRIVAIVSMPQTAFTATGAGVKSSVMFLRKYNNTTIQKIKDEKDKLQNSIKERYNFNETLDTIKQAKNKIIKEMTGFEKPQGLNPTAIKKTDEFKTWRATINTQHKEQENTLREQLLQEYEKLKILEDYDIFMAIAEEIGYDATGKQTQNNELDLNLVRKILFGSACSDKLKLLIATQFDDNLVKITPIAIYKNMRNKKI
jgi:type I restriction enzyme M protein